MRALQRAVKMCSTMVDNVLLILVRMRTWPKQQFFELLRCIIYDGFTSSRIYASFPRQPELNTHSIDVDANDRRTMHVSLLLL